MGDNGNDRKRKHGRWNPKVKQKSVEPGVVGLFFTCEGHEKQALQEAYSIIDEILEDSTNGVSTAKKPEEDPKADNQDEDEGSDEDIADALKKACDDERKPQPGGKKEGRKERRCIQRPTGVKNCLFVSVKDVQIALLAEKIVELTQKTPRCRFLQRVIPVEYTFAVDLPKLNETIMEIVANNMKEKENGQLPTYSVEFKARNNDSVAKNTVLEMVNDALSAFAPTARANLNHADITFFIQVSRTTVMAGVCRDFYTRKKYSMRPVKNTE